MEYPRSKEVKVALIARLAAVCMVYMHSTGIGEAAGNPGVCIVPFLLENVPPHSKVSHITRKYHKETSTTCMGFSIITQKYHNDE